MTKTERAFRIRALQIAYEVQAKIYPELLTTSFEQQLRFWYDHLHQLHVTPNAIAMVAMVDDEMIEKVLRFEIDIRSDRGIKDVLYGNGDNMIGLWMIGCGGKGLLSDIRDMNPKTYTRLHPYAKRWEHHHLKTDSGRTICQHQLVNPTIDLSQVLTLEQQPLLQV